MEFSQEEIIEILTQLGYKIVNERETGLSRKAKYFNKITRFRVEIDGELLDPRVVFKKELKKRIFNI